jgi:hypothetical protein
MHLEQGNYISTLATRQDRTRDSSVFDEHNRRQRIMEYRRTLSDEDFTGSRDNLGPLPCSLLIRINLKCFSQPVKTEIKKGSASENAGPRKVKRYAYISKVIKENG